MKILCVSDHVGPVVYSGSIRDRFGDVELVLGAGDLPLEYYDFIVSMLNKPLFFVFGNHELAGRSLYRRRGSDPLSPAIGREPPGGAVHVGGRIVRARGLVIAGLGGSMWYNGGENQFTELQMWLRLLWLAPRLIVRRVLSGRGLDILLTHAPPRGIHDRPDPCHRGFRSFLWFIRVFRPRYLVHGHIHLYGQQETRQTRLEKTWIVNAYDHFVLEMED